MLPPDPTLAIVLSGGGVRGAFEAGVLQALEEVGLRPGIVSGTSAGAISGAGLAAGLPAAEVRDIWTSVQSRDVYRPRLDLHRLISLRSVVLDPRRLLGIGRFTTSETLLDMVRWTWLFHLGPLRQRLVEVLGGESLDLPDDVVLTVSAVTVDSGEVVRFTNRALPDPTRDEGRTEVVDMTVDHLLASASIPGLFQPVDVDGTSYWDGGLSANTPLAAASSHAPDRIIVVGASPLDGHDRAPDTLGDVLARSVDHLFRAALVQDVEHTRDINALVAAGHGGTHHRHVEITTIVPERNIGGLGDLLDFEPVVAERLADDGLRIARRRLAEEGLVP